MPTVFYHGKYRFYFFSNEFQATGLLEPIHIHIESGENEAKFWIEPQVSLASNDGFRSKELSEIEKVIEINRNEIILKWKQHFNLK
ncbi:MAG TPA: DUF4160 domain-containing protein [Leptospiraceae bacterium]|nr:DUF4160 domain-containing protein [Leptospiraceae bacterium]HMW08502.1 DUF4160 domain-containing protein [Leptospiraceae bacterium]HMX33342.1 DUF4160 domain-containing protein [Leptospiraceae bacterium]HMY34087.1 DUF4160 domain-containing protein [Leptospiraceae bacterium]HMZ64604.1 DUF4160 domain-containing protein [Leptospiraceae bacterium]